MLLECNEASPGALNFTNVVYTIESANTTSNDAGRRFLVCHSDRHGICEAWIARGSPTRGKKHKYAAYRETTHLKIPEFLLQGLRWHYDRHSFDAQKRRKETKKYSIGLGPINGPAPKKPPVKAPSGGFGPLEKETTNSAPSPKPPPRASTSRAGPSTLRTSHICRRDGKSCEADKDESTKSGTGAKGAKGTKSVSMRLLQSSYLRGFRLPASAGGRAGFFFLAPYAFDALHALKRSRRPIQAAIGLFDDAMVAIQKSMAEPLSPREQRMIYGNRIKLRFICWTASLFGEPKEKGSFWKTCELLWETAEQRAARHKQEHEEARKSREEQEKYARELTTQVLNEAITLCQDTAASPPDDPELLLPLWDDCGRLVHFAGVAARLSDQTGVEAASEPCLNCLLEIDGAARCVCDNIELPPKPMTAGKVLSMLERLVDDIKEYRSLWMKILRDRGYEGQEV